MENTDKNNLILKTDCGDKNKVIKCCVLDICALIYQLTAPVAQICRMSESFRLEKLKVS